jgi:hypothetical protein
MPGHNKKSIVPKYIIPKKKKKYGNITAYGDVTLETDMKKIREVDKEVERRLKNEKAMKYFRSLPKDLKEKIKTHLLGVEARRGKTVAKKTTAKKSGAKPSNPALYARVKAEAKRKFKVYPSAYANAWLVRTYKKRGGRYS